ncbi:transcription factor GRAS [Artemisia annua]|uniref:Transcription factor GRAS n=1 Tax=Artemisia annua TaxID=35608 RepID=A0A2U1LJ16_ARTAN|nr:transcription factor GRAS [Artemisia annua]
MNSSSTTMKPDVTLSLTLPSPDLAHSFKPEERGVKLIKLLLTCAKHASSGDLHRADTCLHRISQLASVTGDSMQRLAARFATALANRIIRRWPGLYSALNHSERMSTDLGWARQAHSTFPKSFPFMSFAYAVLTQTLVHAMSWDRVIHIVDLGSGDPQLWASFLQKLSNGPMGPPHVKVTCVSANKVLLDDLGTVLLKEAKSLDMPFQYNPLNVTLIDLTQAMLDVGPGEALAFVSILNFHVLLAEDDCVDMHFTVNENNDETKENNKMAEFLKMLRSMSPKLVLLVEQESDHNLTRLVDRFVEGLHYYSAIFDSIDTTFTIGEFSSDDRIRLEDMVGQEILNMVACEGLERVERHERIARWVVRFSRAGFKPANLWLAAMEEAQQIIESLGPIGYKVVTHRPGLMICWHDRPIYTVSAWIV